LDCLGKGKKGIMSTIQPESEKLRQAVKWVSDQTLDNINKSIATPIQEAALKFNLSPKDEFFLYTFYGKKL
jgi:hypothetical protein